MYRFIVVTDSESASGFRLAGVEVVEANTQEDASRLIPSLLNRDDTGILAVPEEFMEGLDQRVLEKIRKTYRPLVIPIPGRRRVADRTGYLERLLRRAIGYDIVLRR
ncbi:MAG: V-type ATP synthase subunit F [Methanomicrobiales archaeon]|nr:V-type ATP synthase subunit F [Methanomicrobiales archaeon]